MKQTYRKPMMVVAETGMQCALCVLSSEKPVDNGYLPVSSSNGNRNVFL